MWEELKQQSTVPVSLLEVRLATTLVSATVQYHNCSSLYLHCTLHCICTVSALYLHCICTVSALYLHCICTVLCTIYALYLHYICTVYALYMHCICTIYALYMHCTCTVHALYMHGICTKCALYLHCSCTAMCAVLVAAADFLGSAVACPPWAHLGLFRALPLKLSSEVPSFFKRFCLLSRINVAGAGGVAAAARGGEDSFL